MFCECSLPFNIVQPPARAPSPPPPFIHLSLSVSLSPRQEWCLSLRLCAPATSTPTLCCTWTWARTPGSSQGKMPRSESAAHLETKTHTLLHLYPTPPAQNVVSLFSLNFCFLELVSVLVSAQLPGAFGSVRHRLLCGLSEYLLAENNEMFTRNVCLCTMLSPD